jgi:hypothetical protein
LWRTRQRRAHTPQRRARRAVRVTNKCERARAWPAECACGVGAIAASAVERAASTAVTASESASASTINRGRAGGKGKRCRRAVRRAAPRERAGRAARIFSLAPGLAFVTPCVTPPFIFGYFTARYDSGRAWRLHGARAHCRVAPKPQKRRVRMRGRHARRRSSRPPLRAHDNEPITHASRRRHYC